jgi:hypothetical protein
MRRRGLAACLCRAAAVSLLLACTTQPVPRAPTPRNEPPGYVAAPARGVLRRATPAELAVVRALMQKTEQLRGLRFLAPVDVTIEERSALRAYVERAIDQPQLERVTRRYLALGALDPPLDARAIRALLVSVLDEELVGYYDPREKRLAVRADIARALGSEGGPEAQGERSLVWRATVVHELVHALQDQHFGLEAAIQQRRSTDADNAFGALIEGDATLVMLGYTHEQAGGSLDELVQHPEQILGALARSPEQLTGALRRAPALLREPLLFRYREGASFCAVLYRAGGWARVDAAHRAPPVSTLAIRRPQRVLDREPEPALALPSLEPRLVAGLVRDEDVLGALELSVMLGTSGVQAQALIDGWRGDRYAVLERGQQLASIWWLRFRGPSLARSVEQAFVQLGDPLRRAVRKGSLLLVTRGLDAAEHAAVARTFPAASEPAPAAARASKAALIPLASGDPLATARHRH